MAFFDPVGSHPDIVLRVVAARSKQKAQAQIDKYGLGESVKAYGSYNELVEDAEIDVVYIALVNSYHVEWAIRCMEAGKHVLLEKPAAANAAELDLLKSCSARTGKVILEAMHWQFHPAAHKVRELIQSDKYGAVRSVKARMVLPGGIIATDDCRFQYQYAGGSLMDLVYVVSCAKYFSNVTSDSVVAVSSATARLAAGDQRIDEAMTSELSVTTPGSQRAPIAWSVHCDMAQPKLAGLVPKLWDAVPTCTIELEKARIHFENFVGPQLNHSITVTMKTAEGQLTKDKESLTCYTGGAVWGKTGEAWWTTYRYQLEAFVQVVRAVDRGDIAAVDTFQPWVSLNETKTVMSIVDSIYEKAGMPPRKSALQSSNET